MTLLLSKASEAPHRQPLNHDEHREHLSDGDNHSASPSSQDVLMYSWNWSFGLIVRPFFISFLSFKQKHVFKQEKSQ